MSYGASHCLILWNQWIAFFLNMDDYVHMKPCSADRVTESR